MVESHAHAKLEAPVAIKDGPPDIREKVNSDNRDPVGTISARQKGADLGHGAEIKVASVPSAQFEPNGSVNFGATPATDKPAAPAKPADGSASTSPSAFSEVAAKAAAVGKEALKGLGKVASELNPIGTAEASERVRIQNSDGSEGGYGNRDSSGFVYGQDLNGNIVSGYSSN